MLTGYLRISQTLINITVAIRESHAKKNTKDFLDTQSLSIFNIYTKHCGKVSLNTNYVITPAIDDGIDGQFMLADEIHYATEEGLTSFNTVLHRYNTQHIRKRIIIQENERGIIHGADPTTIFDLSKKLQILKTTT